MTFTYILFSRKKNKFYIGATKGSIENRLKEHNRGKTRSTKSGCPWILIHKEIFNTYTEARKRENFLKSGVGRSWIKEHFGNIKEKNISTKQPFNGEMAESGLTRRY